MGILEELRGAFFLAILKKIYFHSPKPQPSISCCHAPRSQRTPGMLLWPRQAVLDAIAISNTEKYECFRTVGESTTTMSKARAFQRQLRQHQVKRTRAALGLTPTQHNHLLSAQCEQHLYLYIDLLDLLFFA